MSSQRAERRRACTGKIRHDSQEAAMKHHRSLGHADALARPAGHPMHAYRCKFCRGWHVGHMPARVLKAMRARIAASHGHRS